MGVMRLMQKLKTRNKLVYSLYEQNELHAPPEADLSRFVVINKVTDEFKGKTTFKVGLTSIDK